MQRALVTFTACALVLVRALAAHAQQVPDPAPARSTPFPDVPKGHWAFDAVEQLRQRGILRGYPPDAKAIPTAAKAATRRSGNRGTTRSRRRR